MRRSSIIMLIAAVALGLVAVILARTFLSPDAAGNTSAVAGGQAPKTVQAVVASADIGFGERLTLEKLKVVDFPVDRIPQGSFQRVDELTVGQGRTALRPIAANEIVIQSALATGANRLSTAPLLGAQMRAVSIPVSEVAGVSGLVYPGDRVDILFTRAPEDAMPYAELLAQSVRVLAVGIDMNVGKDRPEVVRTATVEVTPLQAQKLALAQTVGGLVLSLRQFSDETRLRMQTTQVMDLNDGTITRLVRKSGAEAAAGPPGAPVAPGARGNFGGMGGRGVLVMRGTETTFQPVIGQ